MHKVDSFGATPDNQFTEGDVSTPATVLGADWPNAVQGEIVALVEKAGGTLTKADSEQVVSRVILSAADATGLRAFKVAGLNKSYRAFVENIGGSGSFFSWNNASTATDDGATVIRPATNPSAGRWLIVPTNATNAPNQIQSVSDTRIANTAYVRAAVAALVNAAPSLLDTLSEIDTALNNDPNFATNIINSLSLKAPLSNPNFAGTPTAPTPIPGTNGSQLATTAFVVAAINAVVNGAPGSMDTLQEIAAALGNNPAFATSVNNALALKLSWTNGGFNTPTITLSNSPPPAAGQAGRMWCQF